MINIKFSTRLVIILNNVVIKIPLDKRGYLQSLNEKKIWDKYKNLGLLAELKWIHFGIVCQKRYNTDLFRILKSVVKRSKKLMPEFDFDNCDLYNSKNWGMEGKNYILLDYGVNEYIANLY
jgi:hypothetical protein